jgi:hypothetical protein
MIDWDIMQMDGRKGRRQEKRNKDRNEGRSKDRKKQIKKDGNNPKIRRAYFLNGNKEDNALIEVKCYECQLSLCI